MSRDTLQFFKFLAAMFLPALAAGVCLDARWAKGAEWAIAAAWFASTLLAVGFVIDGGRGAKVLLSSTLQSWAILLIVGLLIGWLVMARFGHSL